MLECKKHQRNFESWLRSSVCEPKWRSADVWTQRTLRAFLDGPRKSLSKFSSSFLNRKDHRTCPAPSAPTSLCLSLYPSEASRTSVMSAVLSYSTKAVLWERLECAMPTQTHKDVQKKKQSTGISSSLRCRQVMHNNLVRIYKHCLLCWIFFHWFISIDYSRGTHTSQYSQTIQSFLKFPI